MMQVSLKAQHRAFQANSSSVTPSSVRHHTLWHKLVQIGLYEQPAFQAKLHYTNTKLCSTKLRDTKLRYQGPANLHTSTHYSIKAGLMTSFRLLPAMRSTTCKSA